MSLISDKPCLDLQVSFPYGAPPWRARVRGADEASGSDVAKGIRVPASTGHPHQDAFVTTSNFKTFKLLQKTTLKEKAFRKE